MTLVDLETALRPQFVWEPGTCDVWKTSKDFEGDYIVGLAVFVGLATLHRFYRHDICQYLNISKKKHDYLLLRYQQHVKIQLSPPIPRIPPQTPQGKKSKRNHLLTRKQKAYIVIRDTKNCKIYRKSLLVQSAIRSSQTGPAILFTDVFKW